MSASPWERTDQPARRDMDGIPAALDAKLHLVGADIVEVAPGYDHAQITGIAAAHVVYELLSALAARKAAP
jgi:arginase family enzyme